MDMLYTEKIRSSGTTGLFVLLGSLFWVIFFWRFLGVGFRGIQLVYLFLGILFSFYVVNYRTLIIGVSPENLLLKFGLIKWRTPLNNIDDVSLDDSPPLIKYGGAGVHFAFVKGIYRAFFNFLEYPRVVVALKRKQGPVQDISFSTRRPEELIQFTRDAIAIDKVD
jgi:hypothetical protein